MLGFCVFYRLLLAQAAADSERPWAHARRAQSDPLPRVTPQTRSNPELLRVAHRFAASNRDYLGAMQRFALVYSCLARQCGAEPPRVP